MDKAVFSVPVCGLIQVHEIHIDRIPGDVAVELRVQVQKGPLVLHESLDPHLGRRERVHPGDDPRTFRIGVGFSEQCDDVFRACRDAGLYHGRRNRIALVEKIRHDLGVRPDLLEHAGAVEQLAAYNEPEFVRCICFHVNSLSMNAPSFW